MTMVKKNLISVVLVLCSYVIYGQTRPTIGNTFSISSQSANFKAEGGTKTFTITASRSWSISKNIQSWGHLSKNGNVLTLRVDANTATSSRSGYFELVSGEKKIRVNITQEGAVGAKQTNTSQKGSAAVLSVSTENLEFSSSGGTKTITIIAEESWDIVAKTFSWEHFTKNGNQLIVKLDENISTASRSDWFTIKSGDKEKRIEIFQEGRSETLTVSPENLEFSSFGGTQTITITTNGDWSIGTPTASWGHLTKSGNQLVVKVDQNASMSSRTDYFTIKAGNLVKRVNITQSAASEISTKSANIKSVIVSNDVDVDGGKGLSIKITFEIAGMKDKDGNVACYFYDSDGNALIDLNNKYGTNGTTSNVAVSKNIKPLYENTLYTDLEMKIPYDELHLSGTYSRTLMINVSIWDKSVSPNKVITKKNNNTFTYNPNVSSYLTVDGSTSDKSKYFSYSGGRQFYDVSCSTGSYEIWGLPSWCSIENKTTSGFTLVCGYNSSNSSRNDYFKVKAAGKEIRIDVQQGGKPGSTSTASRSKSSHYRKTYHRPIIIRDYDRFPEGVEWQSMLGFNAGVVGRYHSPKAVLEGTKSLFAGRGSQASDTISFAWDLSYIGGGLVSRCFFIGFGTGVSGYAKASIHKRDIVIPLYVHIAWYMTGNSYVAPYLATSQGMDLYICQDYGQINTSVGLHSRYDLGILIRPDKDYSKLGISLAFEFGFAPYSYTEERNTKYTYVYDTRWNYERSHTTTIQSLHKHTYGFATYIGGYIAFVF